MYLFGPGRLIASQISSAGALLSPIVFGVVQDVMLDAKVDIKELWGPNRYPVAVADGKGSIDITAKSARIYANPFSMAFGGTTSQGGGQAIAADESHVVPGTPYTVTLANAATNTIAQPLVTAVINGAQVTYNIVASAPVAGVSVQWVVGSPSSLVFAAGDTGVTVLVTYYYSVTGNSDFTITVANPLIASAPFFQLALSQQTNNPNNNQQSQIIVVLNRVLAAGLKLDFKVDDWVIPDFSMKAFADSNGNIGNTYLVN